MSTTYRAVIHEPNKAQPKPDKYGTLTIPGEQSTFDLSIVRIRLWALARLSQCPYGTYCDIHKIEESLIEKVEQEPPSATTD